MKTFKCFYSNSTRLGILLLWLLGWHGAAYGYELIKNLNVSPFLSQSAVYTSNNNYDGDSDDNISFRNSEIGAVFNYKATDELNFSAQIMSRNAGKTDNGQVRADYYFGQYRYFNDFDNTLSVKAGRLRLPYGLYNDTRDVASTNPSILLPQSVYNEQARNTFFSAEGVLLHGDHFYGNHSLTWDAGSVKVEPSDDEMNNLAGFPTANNSSGSWKPMARIIGGFNNNTYKVGYSFRKSDFAFTPDLQGLTVDNGSLINVAHLLSFQYNGEKITLTAEYTRGNVDISFNAAAPINQTFAFEFPNEGFYLQAEYRLSPEINFFIRRDQMYANRNDRDGEDFANALNGVVMAIPAFAPIARPAYSQYSIDNTLGLTWNINPKALARIEWHNVEGTFWLSGKDNPVTADTKKYWNMVMVQFAYRF